jgi:hypothetical protein
VPGRKVPPWRLDDPDNPTVDDDGIPAIPRDGTLAMVPRGATNVSGGMYALVAGASGRDRF